MEPIEHKVIDEVRDSELGQIVEERARWRSMETEIGPAPTLQKNLQDERKIESGG